MSDTLIKLNDINKIYKIGGTETHALKNINLEIQKGEFVAIMGPSGSGKSSLMHILGLLDTPTSGRYILNYQDVSELKGNTLACMAALTARYQSRFALPRGPSL